MKPFFIYQLPLALIGSSLSVAATLEWTGAGDNISFYQEANWQVQGGGAVSGPPLANNIAISDDLIFTGSVTGVAGELQLASSLQLSGASLTLSSGEGLQGGSITLNNTSSLNTQWASNTSITLNSGTITLNGGASPLPGATISCSGSQWTINFTQETTSAVTSEHLSKITIDGQPAQIGVNFDLSSDGASGSTLTPLGDTDEDGIVDAWEMNYFGNLDQTATTDPDSDTLNNLTEFNLGTSPILKDTDSDGLNDSAESGSGVWVSSSNTGTDPTSNDTDSDGLIDGVETRTGIWVSGRNTGTDPLLFNSDGDRVSDGAEVIRKTNPNDDQSEPDLPNIVFIMADDLGYNHISSYGATKVSTPHIDALGSAGIRFTDAYAGCTVCGPSRSSLMTGIHSGHVPYKVNNAYVDLTDRTVTVAEILKKAGYVTTALGKWGNGGVGSGQTPTERGFDSFLGMLDHGHGHRHYPHYLIRDQSKELTGNTTDGAGNTSSNSADRVQHTHDAFTDGALSFIENEKDHAFFCYLAFTLPHTEIIASEAVLNTAEFDPAKWPETYTANTSRHLSQSQPHRNYGAELRMIDNSVGAIVAKLDALGLSENTLVIFTSDNGGQLQSVWGNAPSIYFEANGILRGGKQDSYEGGLRVPFVAKWPNKVPAGATSDLPFYFADFLPTVSDIVGVRPPDYTDGLSILPTLTGNTSKQKKHPYLFWSHQAGRLDHAVRAGKWKAVKRGSNAVEIYNLDTDPSETTNIASSNPTIAQEMQRIIDLEYVPDLTGPQPSGNSPEYPNNP